MNAPVDAIDVPGLRRATDKFAKLKRHLSPARLSAREWGIVEDIPGLCEADVCELMRKYTMIDLSKEWLGYPLAAWWIVHEQASSDTALPSIFEWVTSPHNYGCLYDEMLSKKLDDSFLIQEELTDDQVRDIHLIIQREAFVLLHAWYFKKTM